MSRPMDTILTRTIVVGMALVISITGIVGFSLQWDWMDPEDNAITAANRVVFGVVGAGTTGFISGLVAGRVLGWSRVRP